MTLKINFEQQPKIQIKIAPDTFIKFDGSERITLQNIRSEQSIRIQPDILLVFWNLLDWTPLSEVLAPWPAPDQSKIIDHFHRMHEAQVLITNLDEEATGQESLISNALGKNLHFNLDNHVVMLRDVVRLSAYRNAIEKHITRESIVLDLGAGTGILSFFAAKSGAKKVYAVEKRPDLVLLAQKTAEINNIPNITFIESPSNQVTLAQLPLQPNVLVAELLGNAVLEEKVLEYTLDARDRLLTKGGRLIPGKIDIEVFAFDTEIFQEKKLEVAELKHLYQIDFSLLQEVMDVHHVQQVKRYATHAGNKRMSEPVLVHTLDLNTLTDPVFFTKFELTALQDGHIAGVCAYFRAWLDDEISLTNAPWAPQTHWVHLMCMLSVPKPVKQGDKIPLELCYDGQLRLNFLD